MAQNLEICTVDADVKTALKKFNFRKEKNIAAIILKIDRESQSVIIDEQYEDISVDELRDELPPQQPRYVALSYAVKHDDGRSSYPLIFIFISPQGCKPELQMMYAGSKKKIVAEGGFTKTMELRSVDEFTEEALRKLVRV